jgi:phosphatidylethanolamine/phosphatidyl-N-methylethanolamine N-methyltransferase
MQSPSAPRRAKRTGKPSPQVTQRAKQIKRLATVRRETGQKPALPKRKVVRRALQHHTTMRDSSTQKIYDLHAKFYDATFGRLVRTRIGKAIADKVDLQPGEIAIDVGIGTGGSLPFWPRDVGQVIGIDLSAGMLDKAAGKVVDSDRQDVDLARANALHLPFADQAFDKVFVSHVISVVADPAAVLRECLRVAKPGAKVVMVNHFRSENKVVGAVEKLVCPICTKLGWKSDLALEHLLGEVGIECEEKYKLTKPDLWETVVLRKPA